MTFTLPIPARLLLPLAAFGVIGLAVLPADLSAVHDVKAVTAAPATSSAATTTPSFNVAPLPVAAIDKAPTISSPAPTNLQSVSFGPTAKWPPAWVSEVATSSAPEPPNLTAERVNAAVNVRASGQKGSQVLFVLPAGAAVRIAETEGSWVHVYADAGEGWIYSSFIGAPRQAPAPAADGGSDAGRTIRLAGTVTVRDAPDGAALYRLGAGEQIRIFRAEGNWARIATSTGEGGWVRVE